MSTILIVDDDEDFREMLVSVLALRGFTVIAAATTANGLALAATHELDAAISDYQMPKADGLTFCRALRRQNAQRNRSVPVWLMTGTVTLTEQDARAAGAEGIFRKPFRVTEIISMIERRCHARRASPVAPTPTALLAPRAMALSATR